MCQACNYPDLLERAGLGITEYRLRVLETIGNAASPLSARDIHARLGRHTRGGRNQAINRVTVYRILDHLVDHDLIQRIASGGRSFFYGLAPNARHRPHPHFYCKSCGRMDCLTPEAFPVNPGILDQSVSGEIQNIEVRIDGICSQCLAG